MVPQIHAFGRMVTAWQGYAACEGNASPRPVTRSLDCTTWRRGSRRHYRPSPLPNAGSHRPPPTHRVRSGATNTLQRLVWSPAIRFISALSLTRRMRRMGADAPYPFRMRRMPTAKITFPSVIRDEAATDARSDALHSDLHPVTLRRNQGRVFGRLPCFGHPVSFVLCCASSRCYMNVPIYVHRFEN